MAKVKVFGVYGKDGFLVELEDWSDETFATLLTEKLGGTMKTYHVPPFHWHPRIPRAL